MSGEPSDVPAPADAQAAEAKGPSKKELKKAEAKAKKAASKAANAQTNNNNQPQEESSPNCGDLPILRSAEKISRQFVDVGHLDESKDGQKVLIRARIHNTRSKGNLCFLVLRQQAFTVQAVLAKGEHVNKFMLKFVSSVPCESIVDIEGQVRKANVETTSQKTVEIDVHKLFVVSRSVVVKLPLLVEDAARPQPLLDEQEKTVAALEAQIASLNLEKDAAQLEELQKKRSEANKYVIASQDNRLDHRILDLRTPANQAIFRIQSGICTLFREFLLENNFVEIHTPKIMSAASEGGAQVFKMDYFGTPAFLAQSPQLHKQMVVCGDFERVFEIGPVFRAENSNTPRHMTEFMGLDLEMTIKDHYHEVLEMMDHLFVSIFKGLNKRFARELEVINTQFPYEPLKFIEPSLRLEFPEAVAMLREAGVEIADLEDLNTAQEKELGRLVRAKYNTDFFILDKFPKSARPFYTMIDPKDERYANAYDLFLRGQEITSGAQRVHDYNMLEEAAKAHGIDPKSIEKYLEAFKYGAPPHGGCGIGLERLVFLFLGLDNIRKSSLFPRDPRRVQP